MNGNTETAQKAIAQILNSDHDQLIKSLTFEGIYQTVVEGGFHSETLSDPVVQTERELQENLDNVTDWLRTLQEDGQQTISTSKIKTRIENETGYDLELTE